MLVDTPPGYRSIRYIAEASISKPIPCRKAGDYAFSEQTLQEAIYGVCRTPGSPVFLRWSADILGGGTPPLRRGVRLEVHREERPMWRCFALFRLPSVGDGSLPAALYTITPKPGYTGAAAPKPSPLGKVPPKGAEEGGEAAKNPNRREATPLEKRITADNPPALMRRGVHISIRCGNK